MYLFFFSAIFLLGLVTQVPALMGIAGTMIVAYFVIGHTPSYDERQKQRPRDC